MLSVKLSQPRRKKRRRDLAPKQPFPVPISSLTGIAADDDTWRWYDGVIGEYGRVEISDPESVRMVSTMGFFGETRRRGQRPETLVAVRDFEPALQPPAPDEIVEPGLADSSSEHSDVDRSDVVVEDEPAHGWGRWKSAQQTRDGGDVLVLDHYDAFFLSFGVGCLRVSKDGHFLSIDDLWSDFCRRDVHFRPRYAAYHHFRAKTWIVRDGTKFGNDFLLYKDGPPFYHASYSVRVRTSEMSWTELSALNRVTESAAKELLIAHVCEDASKRAVSAADYLDSVTVSELLVRRWVAAQKRECSD
jgi:tRNA-intron lyase